MGGGGGRESEAERPRERARGPHLVVAAGDQPALGVVLLKDLAPVVEPHAPPVEGERDFAGRLGLLVFFFIIFVVVVVSVVLKRKKVGEEN